MQDRAGTYQQQPSGYKAFIPHPLPPQPSLRFDQELTNLLSQADRHLGRLDGVTSILPNPDLFVAMYVRQEAVLSSQIEGTQSTLEDVLQFEIDLAGHETPRDVQEVVNYVRSINYGLQRLSTLPLSLRLIRELHSILLENVRGSQRQPGEWRTLQNWIGSAQCTLQNATFVPPPATMLGDILRDFEAYLHVTELPPLIHCGLIHAQFETIHPFMDGNGRIGRLLITLLLCQRQILQRPLLYLSSYLKANRLEYYDRLMTIRNNGDWEGWLKFFLKGTAQVSAQATETARTILALRETHRALIHQHHQTMNAAHLLDYLYTQPIVTIRLVQEHLNCAYTTAANVVQQFTDLGLLHETTGAQRNRRFVYQPYLNLFEASRSHGSVVEHLQSTQSEP